MHTIRLAGSWEWEPGDVGRCGRRFHWMARLSDGERVWLVLQPEDEMGPATVLLNGERLGVAQCTDQPARFDITPYLEQSNRVVIEFPSHSMGPPHTACPPQIAQLEVESGGL